MQSDEQQIRQLVQTWLEATQAGDTETVLNLMTDDVVFLLPNQQSMVGKAAFAAAAAAMAGQGAPKFAGTSEIQEIQLRGDWAFMWTRLKVVATPPAGKPVPRAGFTLSVLRKEHGQWRIARDANILSPVAGDEHGG